MYVVVVAFSMCVRVVGECSADHCPPVLFKILKWRSACMYLGLVVIATDKRTDNNKCASALVLHAPPLRYWPHRSVLASHGKEDQIRLWEVIRPPVVLDACHLLSQR